MLIYSLMVYLETLVTPARISNSSMWITLRNGHRYLVLKKNTGDRNGSQNTTNLFFGSARLTALGLDFQLDIYRKLVSSLPGMHFCLEFH